MKIYKGVNAKLHAFLTPQH